MLYAVATLLAMLAAVVCIHYGVEFGQADFAVLLTISTLSFALTLSLLLLPLLVAAYTVRRRLAFCWVRLCLQNDSCGFWCVQFTVKPTRVHLSIAGEICASWLCGGTNSAHTENLSRPH